MSHLLIHNNNKINNNKYNDNDGKNIDNENNSSNKRVINNDIYVCNNGNEYNNEVSNDKKTDKLVLFGGHIFETMSCHNICQIIDLPRDYNGSKSNISNGGSEDDELGVVKRKYLKEDKNLDFVVNTYEFNDLNVFTFPSCVMSLPNSVVQDTLV